jgi:hypothetical protein
VLTPILVGELWARTSSSRGRLSIPAAIIAFVLLFSVGSWTWLTLRPEVGHAAKALVKGGPDEAYAAQPLRGIVDPTDRLLSEDPYVAVSRGELPVVLDPFMLVRRAPEHPTWTAALVGRIRSREFDKILLRFRLEFSGDWYQRFSLRQMWPPPSGTTTGGRRNGKATTPTSRPAMPVITGPELWDRAGCPGLSGSHTMSSMSPSQ